MNTNVKAKVPRFCHLCGEQLRGGYLVYDTGLVACERCERTVPHCERCKVPSRQLTQVRDQRICPSCLKQLSICASCRIPILGRYYLIGDSAAKYCETCVQTRPRCDICRVPLDEQGQTLQLAGGVAYRCADCFRQAVKSAEEGRRLYLETVALLKRDLQMPIEPLPRLTLVERSQLQQLHHQSSPNQEKAGADVQHLLGYFQRINQQWDIYIENYLPEPLFRAVAAHELAHAWQMVHAVSGQEPEIVEGFAEWVAYRTLLNRGEQRAAARMTRRQDLYGKGLQYFIALERRLGFQQTVQRATLRNP